MFGQLSTLDKAAVDSLLVQKNYREVIKIYKSQGNINTLRSPENLSIIGQCYESINKEDSAFFFYKKALKEYKKIGNKKNEAEINLEIFSLLDSQKKLSVNPTPYFNAFYEYAINSNSKEMLAKAYNNLGITNFSAKNVEIPKEYFIKSLAIYIDIDSIKQQANLHSNLAVLHINRTKKFDSARLYLNNALQLLKQDNKTDHEELFYVYNNIGNSYLKESKYDKAIIYFTRADSIVIKTYSLNKKRLLYENLVQAYAGLKKYDSTYAFMKKLDSIKEQLNITKQNTLINDVKEKYDNEKLRSENLALDLKRTTNRNLLFAALGMLILGSIIFSLIQKNTKRKQRIAEQEREIEIQKTEKVLKEQELNTIDAMLVGQEKERKKLAEDLHDSVGATLAAAKLQFNHLSQHRDKLDTMDELFSKTSILLDDAYAEIRDMAHLKNSGVIAKNGLLPALQKLAKNASSAHGLQVIVENFGLEQRLESTKEITIFRIVQELITNIIKHAEATEASVSLTPHEDELSIIIEDNGKGFIPRMIIDKSGMGLASIERRVEHIDGTMEIDSTPGNGTTILIDIPL